MGLAPQLHHCEFDPDLRMFMVVMDHVKGSHWHRDNVSASLGNQLRQAVEALHQAGLVYGDLREPNVMVDESGRVQFVDFDWCGLEGEATYPLDISMGAIDWAADVGPGSLITAAA
ncbi:hypothetical protein MIND_00687900 [Mycena indigotica]|uniref:Protein kinase domain-containing protein n=1 Tax=Mycena indigotica TaxID=2126181 RepID=A0A8H6W366_9AGAR|nr:uncharacterized protein MIND_00687900 [Mycena indigotica]KAF7301231.1 hypothetical protein MIND_00687900 [Mycena indigotica]